MDNSDDKNFDLSVTPATATENSNPEEVKSSAEPTAEQLSSINLEEEMKPPTPIMTTDETTSEKEITPMIIEQTEEHLLTPEETGIKPSESGIQMVPQSADELNPMRDVDERVIPSQVNGGDAAMPSSGEMVMSQEMPGQTKSHVGLYIAAAVFVILVGSGVYAYSTNLFGLFRAVEIVNETQSEEVKASAEEEEVEEEIIVDDEMVVGDDEIVVDELAGETDLTAITDETAFGGLDVMTTDETALGGTEGMITDETGLGEEIIVDGGASTGEDIGSVTTTEETSVVTEDVAGTEENPPRVKRTTTTTSTTETVSYDDGATEPDAMTEPADTPAISADYVDCGTDMDCFIASAETCALASVSQIVLGVNGIYAITGGDTESCKLMTTAAGYQQECTFPHADLMTVLNKWKVGEYSTEDYDSAECAVL